MLKWYVGSEHSSFLYIHVFFKALKAKRIAEGPAMAKVEDKTPVKYAPYSFEDGQL